ncbi:MMPL family transporter [Lentzea albidocapillata]|uniref:Putative drug exporter of the RND superfamily n=1 Tax=Lentzea albidocapillata TaxID=40571 RepID=A0A1W2ADC6_9PSEU|nr:MMPL family transporter [Lentzea albidocapillata]SMC58603.1 putative drug exporter of the RND superfamily [Lentzea albidocapillata]
MAKLLYKLGMGTYRRRLPVVLIWLLVLIGTGVGAFTLGGETSNSMSIPGQESTTALERIQEKFGSGETASARVVVQAPDGQKLPQHIKAITDLVADESALKGVRSATNPLDPAAPSVNADVNVGYSTVTYDVKPGEVTDEQRAELTKAVDKARAAGLTVEVTGTAMQETPHVGGPTEAIGVVLALVVLALTYGSLVTAGMNLLSAGIGVGIGTLGITIVSGFMDLQSTTPILASMLGLAVGIDYALFIINRYRQELRRGSDVGHAVATAVGTAGSAVVTAGLTVVIALVGLAIAGIPFLTQMGVSAAATIVVSVLIAITLVPAVLSLLGRRVLTRKERAAAASEPKDRGVIRAWGGAITRNRVLALLLSVVALGIVAIPVASMDTTLIQKPPAGSTQERADQILAKGFGEGFNGPIIVLFEGEGAGATATEASKPIAKLSDVALVTPAQPSQDGKSALVTVIPKSGPDTVETEKLVADLRAELSGVEGGKAYVTGATAVSVDVATSLDKALPIYLAVVVGLALVLLVLVFRSLLVPLVGVLGFLLTIGASLGATVAVFQWGWLAGAVNLDSTGPLISLTPILVIGILFGLAMDYQIFLVSRMHEAHHRGAKPIEAITTGFRQAAPVVVAAALIMFSVFAGFVPAGEATVKSIAFALAVGIFVDAFVVRMVLVPAALALLGERAWWLPKSLRWLPELDVEGTALDETEKKDKLEPVSVG